jgi:hypothetical protein
MEPRLLNNYIRKAEDKKREKVRESLCLKTKIGREQLRK